MTKICFEYNYDDCDDEENEGDGEWMESAGLTSVLFDTYVSY